VDVGGKIAAGLAKKKRKKEKILSSFLIFLREKRGVIFFTD